MREIAEKYYECRRKKYIYEKKLGWCYIGSNNIWRITYGGSIDSVPMMRNDIVSVCRNELGIENEEYIDRICKPHNMSKLHGYLKELYNMDDAVSLFNSNSNLFAFNDVVYDVFTREYREIRVEDYITVTCGYNYREASEEEKERVMKYLRDIFTDEEKLKYVLKSVSSVISGKKLDKCNILYGVAQNGKRIFFNLCKIALGGYCNSIPFEILGKRVNDNIRCNELVEEMYSRMLIADDMNEKGRLNGRFMSRLMGNEKITCSKMYVIGVSYVPKYSIFIKTNMIPVITDMDIIEDSINVVKCDTYFVDNPKHSNHMKEERGLNVRIREEVWWKYGFMGILIDMLNDDSMSEVDYSLRSYMIENAF
jgi:putative DNA primase/helicase